LSAKKVIISGGGTGGHLFPAISIANTLRQRLKDVEILFVGAEGKLEMEKVPKAGYQIVGLPIEGFIRRLTYKNLFVIGKLMISIRKASGIIQSFKPDVVVGVGGYASGPILFVAARRKIPTIIQEQNSFAGITNRILGKRADKICVAYDQMSKFFPEEKIIKTGNPVRLELFKNNITREDALIYFNIPTDRKIILITGGSGGARQINESVISGFEHIRKQENVYIIWQTGKNYYARAIQNIEKSTIKNIKVFDFIDRMDMAYAAADVIVSRAGAGTISELCILGKPVIFVPSPNVAEDHQTKNAISLVEKKAGIIVSDGEAKEKLVNQMIELVSKPEECKILSENIKSLAMENSAEFIVDEIVKLFRN
jgi:UDP-N-acetylglucosamine--N-acetylmuramyl-(pentapeptide) pyrophosphoryl-undecaprenol N-acetylglucosamine transferase